MQPCLFLFILCSTCHFSLRRCQKHPKTISFRSKPMICERSKLRTSFPPLRPWPRRALRKKEQIQLVSGFRTAQAMILGGDSWKGACQRRRWDHYRWLLCLNTSVEHETLPNLFFAGTLKNEFVVSIKISYIHKIWEVRHYFNVKCPILKDVYMIQLVQINPHLRSQTHLAGNNQTDISQTRHCHHSTRHGFGSGNERLPHWLGCLGPYSTCAWDIGFQRWKDARKLF